MFFNEGIMKLSLNRYLIWAVTLICLFGFYFCVCFFQMPKGDDLLAPFYMGFMHYVDGYELNSLERTETIAQAINQFISYYLQFNGRLTMLFQGYLLNKVGWFGISLISSEVYVLTILLIGRIGLRSWEAVVKSPFFLVLTSLYMYELTATGSYIEMWTFVCQYGVPTLLYLLYYMLITNFYELEEISKWKVAGIGALGVIAGACHECLGALCIFLVSIRTSSLLVNKKICLKKVWINAGLLFGYICTLFAPGNFKRLLSEHDVARFSLGIVGKIQTSIESHFLAFGGLQKSVVILVGIFFIFIVLSFVRNKMTILSIIKENSEIILTLFASVIMWAVFAPPVPQYGLQFWKALLIIWLLRGIATNICSVKVWNVLSVMALAIWVYINGTWMPDLIRVTTERQVQIAEAVENKQDVVYVSQYPESTNRWLTHFNMANQNKFESVYAIEYYGTKVLIKSDE